MTSETARKISEIEMSLEILEMSSCPVFKLKAWVWRAQFRSFECLGRQCQVGRVGMPPLPDMQEWYKTGVPKSLGTPGQIYTMQAGSGPTRQGKGWCWQTL